MQHTSAAVVSYTASTLLSTGHRKSLYLETSHGMAENGCFSNWCFGLLGGVVGGALTAFTASPLAVSVHCFARAFRKLPHCFQSVEIAARVANRNKVDVKRVGAATERVGVSGGGAVDCQRYDCQSCNCLHWSARRKELCRD